MKRVLLCAHSLCILSLVFMTLFGSGFNIDCSLSLYDPLWEPDRDEVRSTIYGHFYRGLTRRDVDLRGIDDEEIRPHLVDLDGIFSGDA
jgi:hypothetical protein